MTATRQAPPPGTSAPTAPTGRARPVRRRAVQRYGRRRTAAPTVTVAPDIDADTAPTQSRWRHWFGLARTVVRLSALSATAGLLFWALMPAALGWEPALVVSGSMMPAVRPGDIVVVAPVPRATLAKIKGMIVLMEDPAVPGNLLLHRAVGHMPDGALVTKGDANYDQDRAPVPLSTVHGVARLRVPYAGLPVLWLRTGRTVPVVALALALLMLAWPERQTGQPISDHPALPRGRHRA